MWCCVCERKKRKREGGKEGEERKREERRGERERKREIAVLIVKGCLGVSGYFDLKKKRQPSLKQHSVQT